MLFKDYITTKNVIFFILLIIMLKFASSINEILMLFFACFVIACSLNPLVSLLQKKIKNRTAATSIVILLTVIATFAFFIPVFVVAIKQVSAFFSTFPQKIALIDNYIEGMSIYGYKLDDIFDLNAIWGTGAQVAQEVFSKSLNFTMGVFQGIIVFIAIITILFYFVKDKNYMKDKFIEFFPDKMKTKASEISGSISGKVGGYVIAQLISNIAIWILVSLYLWILGVDYAFLLGLISGLLDIIPVVGPTVALVLILVTAYPHGAITMIIATVLFLAVQQISNNLVRPIVFGKFLDLHPLVIIFALFVGAKFLGVFGVIFAPAIAAIISVLIDELYLKPINKSK